ncbi:hypothetical protein CPB83DRAFT_859047 [Crepidotus variabilis]|uniref:Histone deacetylase interacting domain-containing protein n=1 Tax=Crepidotus variabilis TaxID=179855 RepID=A0A9P6JMI5_9AGAR|nr:hypothetical protein CPB83DRAFT_859047 [Crepidotus variabilis]
MDSEEMLVDSPRRQPDELKDSPSIGAVPPQSLSNAAFSSGDPVASQTNDRKSTPKPDNMAEPVTKEDRNERISTPRAATPVLLQRSSATDFAQPAPTPLPSQISGNTDHELLMQRPPSSMRSRRGSPLDPQGFGSAPDRALNVTDALSYLDAVKNQFNDQPDVYNHFLDIMKEFKNEQIDTPGVIRRVSHLFHGHPALIQGFNTFLPIGYRIECSTDPQDIGIITVTTPTGTTTQTTSGPMRGMPWSSGANAGSSRHDSGYGYGASIDHSAPMPTSPDPRAYPMDGQAIEPAVQYVQKIKQRCDPETYRQFLDILTRYHHTPESIDEEEVSRQIARLFKDAPDLRADFRIFMPDRGGQLMDDAPHSSRKDKDRRKLDVVANSMSNASSLPQKRKRKATEKEKEREKEQAAAKNLPPSKKHKHGSVQDLAPISYNPKHVVAAPSSPRRGGHHPLPLQPSRALANDDIHFFDRVKLFIADRDIYNEFLKLVNLFAQDFIDTPRLVKESRNFLGNTDLYRQFMTILGWDEKKEQEWARNEQTTSSGWAKAVVAAIPVRPGRIDMAERYGSYRKVSTTEANVPCSGRDEMCRSVLNDEWVSHPTWTSEDLPFMAHKKNIYEEALHRSEEERHEYDFHIEAITRTIMALEPINNKIAQMSPEERVNYKLKANLGGSWKAVHQRVIKKIYGRDAGMEVVNSMQDSPALAIPVVLQRLKQKEEEWKRAQREWNKVWREVDARNYAKSLDHQALAFKMSDKRAITTKALLNQIETAREEQMAKRASLIDPLFARTRPRYQLEFLVENEGVLHDTIKLVLSFLDRTQVAANDRKRIETFLRSYVPLFFCLNPVEFNSAFVVHDVVESENNSDTETQQEEIEPQPVLASGSRGRNGRSHAKNVSSSGDLRKKLLKSEQAKSTSRKTRAQEAASPAASRFASPVPMEEDKGESSSTTLPSKRSPKINNVFFTNTTFYTLMRLIEMLYSRLNLFRGISAQLVSSKMSQADSALVDPNLEQSAPSGTQTPSGRNTSHFYEMLLGLCERLFENEIEQHLFEDQMRAVFGLKHAYKIFTVDKVIGAIIKQVQAVIADPKSQDLLEHLKRERLLAAPTTQDRINSRRNAEKVLGPDENVFRIDWLAESKMITFQLIGKDDSSYDDTEVLTGRWQAYIDAFVSGESTDGVSQNHVRRPFLRRNLPESVKDAPPDVSSQDGLEIKVCVRTYRLFYVSHTEDFMWKSRSKDEMERASRPLKSRNRKRKAWIDDMQEAQ